MERVPLFLKKLQKTLARRTATVPRGFTLIEMLVVLAIFVIITSVVLVSQTQFNRTLLLTDTAYNVALSLRETQSLGLSSKAFNSLINEGFGIHFDTSSNTSYEQFGDISRATLTPPSWCPTGTPGHPDSKNGNCIYDGAPELVQQYTFSQGYTLNQFCAYSNGVSLGCSPSGITSLDILFQRPNTTTIMTVKNNFGVYRQADTACIQIQSPDDATNEFIKVTQLGEISVASTCP
jgi:prepilin-type N-terminal cleavage/methylation domain-containing protein